MKKESTLCIIKWEYISGRLFVGQIYPPPAQKKLKSRSPSQWKYKQLQTTVAIKYRDKSTVQGLGCWSHTRGSSSDSVLPCHTFISVGVFLSMGEFSLLSAGGKTPGGWNTEFQSWTKHSTSTTKQTFFGKRCCYAAVVRCIPILPASPTARKSISWAVPLQCPCVPQTHNPSILPAQRPCSTEPHGSRIHGSLLAAPCTHHVHLLWGQQIPICSQYRELHTMTEWVKVERTQQVIWPNLHAQPGPSTEHTAENCVQMLLGYLLWGKLHSLSRQSVPSAQSPVQ